MRKQKFTNSQIGSIDWAREDRAIALFRLHRKRVAVSSTVADSGWGRDVSGDDKRSVKAQLAGKGDFRASWWTAFSAVYLALFPASTLEMAMYRFHSLHHRITLACLGFTLSARELQGRMASDGMIAALHGAIVTDSPRR